MRFKFTVGSDFGSDKKILRVDLVSDTDGVTAVHCAFRHAPHISLNDMLDTIEMSVNSCITHFTKVLGEKQMAEKWMSKVDCKKGALRKEMGVKKGKKIPAKALDKETHSKNPKMKKRAVLAETFKKADKKKK